MELFFKIAAAVILTAIVSLTIGSIEKEYGIIITIAGSCAVFLSCAYFLTPIIDFVWEIANMSGQQSDIIISMCKITGLSFLCDVSCAICNDAGNTSLGKTLQLCGTVVVLWIALPIFQSLLQILRQILGGI